MPENLPLLRSIVIDTTDARGLAEFYRELLGYEYGLGDEMPPEGQPDPRGDDWLVLKDPNGHARFAFQRVDAMPESTWPDADIPQQVHLDFTVPSADDLVVQHKRALALGALVLDDRSDDPDEPLFVYADPSGHPFCIFVAPAAT